MSRTYTATAEPVGRYWHIEVAGVGVTQARSAAQVEAMARDLIESMKDEAGAVVEVSFNLPPAAVEHRARAEVLRRQEVDAREAAARASREAVRALRGAGLSQPDIGVVLGISHQRVSQLLANA